MRRQKNATDQWTDEERIDLFREKGRELLAHPFVVSLQRAGTTGISIQIGERRPVGGRPAAISVRGAPPLETQAVEALVRLFYLHNEPIALDQIAGIVGRVDPGKAALLKPILQEYRRALGSRPGIPGVEIMTTGYSDDFTFKDLVEQQLFGNATHVEKGPRLERKRLLGNDFAEALFGRTFYQQALLIVVDTVKAVIESLDGTEARVAPSA